MDGFLNYFYKTWKNKNTHLENDQLSHRCRVTELPNNQIYYPPRPEHYQFLFYFGYALFSSPSFLSSSHYLLNKPKHITIPGYAAMNTLSTFSATRIHSPFDRFAAKRHRFGRLSSTTAHVVFNPTPSFRTSRIVCMAVCFILLAQLLRPFF